MKTAKPQTQRRFHYPIVFSNDAIMSLWKFMSIDAAFWVEKREKNGAANLILMESIVFFFKGLTRKKGNPHKNFRQTIRESIQMT